MIASPLLALDLPRKVLVWQRTGEPYVWVSTTTVACLSERYALPPELAGKLAVVDAVVEQALAS